MQGLHVEADDAEPTLLFETDKHAAFANATVGSTMAVTGSRWNCTVYTTGYQQRC